MFKRESVNGLLLALTVLAIVGQLGSAMSIDTELVKVTHKNSGPRYDIDRDDDPLDRSKLTPVVERPASDSNNSNREESDPEAPEGQLHIRRILLIPLMRAAPAHFDEAADKEPKRGPGEPVFAKPFWPFLTPARPAHPHQLYGADEASRSPSDDQDKAATNQAGEREGSLSEADQRPSAREPLLGMFDPIQMMMDIMHQAINSQLMPSSPKDLNKDASGDERPQSPGTELAASDSGKPPVVKPTSQNETREDVVEIEGKKYLRKTVINRHVGENIIFMTKRLIFVPLNETEPATTTTSTMTPLAVENKTEKPVEELTTTTTTTSSPIEAKTERAIEAKTEKAIEEAAMTMAPPNPTTTTTTTAAASETAETTTKAKESWVDRVSDAIDKAAERLVENAKSTTTTTAAPEKQGN